MSKINEVLKIEGVRQKIFKYKCNRLYKNINKIRKPILERNHDYYEKIKDEYPGLEAGPSLSKQPLTADEMLHNYALERSMNWRESAAVLGLYYLLN